MQIVIPMSGFGERFRRAGYSIPKPLISVEGKPIIAHVIDMFPGEADFHFICNADALENPSFQMRETLENYCPTGRIHSIPSHKLGPVHAVQMIQDSLKADDPVIVNYCDFTCYWDWKDFKATVDRADIDGCIPAYKGFHPHSLGQTNYAYLRLSDNEVIDIQEKQPFTENRMEEFASSGTYYFSSARLMTDAFSYVREKSLSVNGEFYVSLAFKYLLSQKMTVVPYGLQHFMQWGTPEDVFEYNYWSSVFRQLITERNASSTDREGALIIPAAGRGQRFRDEGYTDSKPMIEVSSREMIIRAVDDLPPASQKIFILRKDLEDIARVRDVLNATYDEPTIVILSGETGGQAETVRNALDEIPNEVALGGSTITIGACDSGFIYNDEDFRDLIDSGSADVIVWVKTGYPNADRFPSMYGWVDVQDGVVKGVSVKKSLKDTRTDPIITGTFTFRNQRVLVSLLDRLLARGGVVNGEYYLDSCIEDALMLGLSVQTFEVEEFLCWGTPNDLKTFHYWQSCFHKWKGHEYSIDRDPRISANEKIRLIAETKIFDPLGW